MMTTRAQPGEVDGNYFFRTRGRVWRAIRQGQMLEYAEYVGNYYGTPDLYQQSHMNRCPEIEVRWFLQVKKKVSRRCLYLL